MMNLTVRNRIIVSFLLIIAILVLLAGASYARLVQIEKEANGIRNGSIPGLYHPSKAQELWSRHMLDTRRLLLRAVDEDVTIVLDTYRDQFATLRDLVEVSDSVLSKHLSALKEAGYVDLRKAALDGRQRTWASLTRAGRQAFRDESLACGYRWPSPDEALHYAMNRARELIRSRSPIIRLDRPLSHNPRQTGTGAHLPDWKPDEEMA